MVTRDTSQRVRYQRALDLRPLGKDSRQLYTDQDGVLFDAARPVILNRIEDIITRPLLRKIGIEIGFGREGRARTRTIHIATTPSDAATESTEARRSTSSAPSLSAAKTNSANDFPEVHARTKINALPSAADPNAAATVRSIPLQNNAADDVDEADAKIPLQSALENTGTRGWRARL